MSIPRKPEPHPEAAHYAYRLGYIARDIITLADRAVEFPDLRKQLQRLTLYVGLLRWTLPQDGAAIGPRWWQRYARFYSIVEDLCHPELNDDLEFLWMGLPDTN
jgi:hypothetical protein